MSEFLDIYDTLKLNQDKINILNRCITLVEIERLIKNTTKKRPGSNGFNTEFCHIFKEKPVSIIHKLLHKIETERTFPNSFYESTITLMPKPHKYSTK